MQQYDIEYYTCVIYAYANAISEIDFFAEIHDHSRVFQWNFSGVKATKKFSWDMDGVICTDPIKYDDDGKEYRDEILHGVKPYILPQVKVHSIITNRIERWRPETVEWLKRHGVQYKNLIMQPFATAEERRRNSKPAEYKAMHFKNSDSTIFIESDDKQARTIAKISNKPTLSVEEMTLYGGLDNASLGM